MPNIYLYNYYYLVISNILIKHTLFLFVLQIYEKKETWQNILSDLLLGLSRRLQYEKFWRFEKILWIFDSGTGGKSYGL